MSLEELITSVIPRKWGKIDVDVEGGGGGTRDLGCGTLDLCQAWADLNEVWIYIKFRLWEGEQGWQDVGEAEEAAEGYDSIPELSFQKQKITIKWNKNPTKVTGNGPACALTHHRHRAEPLRSSYLELARSGRARRKIQSMWRATSIPSSSFQSF